MIANNNLRIHVINVGHGDGILIEFPDLNKDGRGIPRFGIVDAGTEYKSAKVKNKVRDYIARFLNARLGRDFQVNAAEEDYIFEFVCLTHPHRDHLNGILPVLNKFCADSIPQKNWPREFWDSGFRYNTVTYFYLLEFLRKRPEIQFTRLSSGTEFYFGDIRITVLAPSVDMRNRYDTYGVEVNNASIVLKIDKGNVVGILAGDAHFESWGKISEEFPRKKHLTYSPTKNQEPGLGDLVFLSEENQLKCHFLKVSHHGSKEGTSYEYIDELSPNHFAITCAKNSWYKTYNEKWTGKFPHPITRLILGEETGSYEVESDKIPKAGEMSQKVGLTVNGTMIYTFRGPKSITRVSLEDAPDKLPSMEKLKKALGPAN